MRDIAYTEVDGAGRRQTLDLYLPPETGAAPALLAFVHGGFWTLSDDLPEYRIGPGLAEVLRAEGVAVALVRYRLAPADPHPAAVQDVAAAIAFLLKSAERHGYDPERVFVAGHSAGGHLVTLAALDAAYLAAHGVHPTQLAGVASISGIYDVTPPTVNNVRAFGAELAARRAASPVEHLGGTTPPLLLVSGLLDMPGFARASQRFEKALRTAGHEGVELRMMLEQDHFSLLRFDRADHPVLAVLLAWLRGQALPAQPDFELSKEAHDEKNHTWRAADWMAPFREHPELIRTHDVDQRFAERLDFFFGDATWREQSRYRKLAKATSYEALDLFEYLAAQPPETVGTGDTLVITNLRDEQLVWTREQLAPYEPVVVISVGEAANLFRFTFEYRAKMQYSWREDLRQPPQMLRPVGAFLHFLKPPPRELEPLTFNAFSLLPRSFRWTDDDPYASIRDLPQDLFEVMTWRNGCVYCHSFRQAGTRAFHTTTRSARPFGGFALPLEEYPPDVWKRFVFQPRVAAEMIGVTPNIVEGDLPQKLYDLVERERAGTSR